MDRSQQSPLFRTRHGRLAMTPPLAPDDLLRCPLPPLALACSAECCEQHAIRERHLSAREAASHLGVSKSLIADRRRAVIATAAPRSPSM